MSSKMNVLTQNSLDQTNSILQATSIHEKANVSMHDTFKKVDKISKALLEIVSTKIN